MSMTGNVTIRGKCRKRKTRKEMATTTTSTSQLHVDVEYTPKAVAQAQVWVIHDERTDDAWTNPPLLQNNRNSRRRASGAAAAATGRSIRRLESEASEEESETEGRRTPTREEAASNEEYDDEPVDGLPLSSRTSELEAEETPTSSSQSPRRMLKKLRVSHTAVRIPQAEDPYFAGRLVQISTFMIHDGQLVEATRLGRWGVDLVGKKEWDKWVEYYGPEPRLETDNGDFVALLLLDIDNNLRPIDEARAEELRGMSLEWQAMGILPRRSG